MTVRSSCRCRQHGVANLYLILLIAFIIVGLGFYVAYQFVDPAPPTRIVMATGADGGAYQRYGDIYASLLAENGIEVVRRETAGSAENLDLLRSDTGVDVAFVQSGLAEGDNGGALMTLGSLYFEPLLLVVRDDYPVKVIADLMRARLSIGEPGSGSRAVALRLLAANRVAESEAQLVTLAPDEVGPALASGVIDAAFVVADLQSAMVMDVVSQPGVSIAGLERADAYARRFPFFSSITLPEGVLDLAANTPETEVETLATTAMLVSRTDLHPALVDLLLISATKIHGGHSLLANRGTFPSSHYVDIPLSDQAERYFRRGPPFLLRYLPFWAATLIDRMWVMIFPLIGIGYPVVKMIIPAYQWQVRRRLLRLYTELEGIDPNIVPIGDAEDLEDRRSQVEKLERQSAVTAVPRDYKDAIYKLRRDIDLVRRRLERVVS